MYVIKTRDSLYLIEDKEYLLKMDINTAKIFLTKQAAQDELDNIGGINMIWFKEKDIKQYGRITDTTMRREFVYDGLKTATIIEVLLVEA